MSDQGWAVTSSVRSGKYSGECLSNGGIMFRGNLAVIVEEGGHFESNVLFFISQYSGDFGKPMIAEHGHDFNVLLVGFELKFIDESHVI